MTIPRKFEALRGARRLVGRAADNWGRPDLAETAQLLTSELVTNAIRSARSRVHLGIVKLGTGLRVTVWDDGVGGSGMGSEGDESGGYWMLLLRALADGHGTLRSDDGTRGLWFQLS